MIGIAGIHLHLVGRALLCQFGYRDTCAAKLHMLVVIVAHAVCAQVLSDEFAQGAGSGAVEDAYDRLLQLYGIVYEIGNGSKCFVGSHTAQIYFRLEVQLLFVDGIAGGLAYECGSLLRFVFLRRI